MKWGKSTTNGEALCARQYPPATLRHTVKSKSRAAAIQMRLWRIAGGMNLNRMRFQAPTHPPKAKTNKNGTANTARGLCAHADGRSKCAKSNAARELPHAGQAMPVALCKGHCGYNAALSGLTKRMSAKMAEMATKTAMYFMRFMRQSYAQRKPF